MSKRSLSTMIRRLREAKGWTQAELAKKARVTQGYISQLEAGSRKSPGVRFVQRLANALGVPLDSLFEMAPKKDAQTMTRDVTMRSTAYRLHFRLSDIFPLDDPLTIPLIRLMMATNDVRHIQKLLLMTGERLQRANEFERTVLNGELLHLDRLLCGHLYEAGNAFRSIDNARPELADAAVRGEPQYEQALRRLREAYASDPPGAFHHSFLSKVRNQFGFHYGPEDIQAKLRAFISDGNVDGTVIAAEFSGLSRHVIADHLSIGMLQDLLAAELHDLQAKFVDAMQRALQMARDLSDVVDLMLLPLLERNQAAIRKQEKGTLLVPPELMKAKQKVDETRTRGPRERETDERSQRP